MTSPSDLPLITGLGEILWDIFPDGPRFGGAPANFACAAAGLGARHVRVAVVSAVGSDELGRKALQSLTDRGVNISGVQVRNQRTGQVNVKLDRNGQASYEFADDTAWDNLTWSDTLAELARHTNAVCFGTLAQRDSVAGETISRFLQSTSDDCIRILDVNLRPPHWTDDVVLTSLELANVVKCNDEELPIISSLLQLSGSDVDVMRHVIDRCGLRMAVLTRGANGSVVVDASGEVSECRAESMAICDTVGAGDALTAALTIGLLHSMSIPEVHQWASRVAGFVCTQTGATPVIPTMMQMRNS